MAKKKRKRGRAGQRRPPARPASGAEVDERGKKPSAPKPVDDKRVRKKQLGREAREAARKQVRRRTAVNRWARLLAILAAVGVGVFLLLPSGSGAVEGAALEVGRAAGCDEPNDDEVESAPGNLHNPPYGNYPTVPATSGAHASPLPDQPDVFDEPIPEENAVHNLEHSFVILYYRADGKQALAPEVVQELESIARSEDMVFAAPHGGLPEGTSLSMAAWNKLWNCPGDITPEDTRTVAQAFVDSYRGTSNAPEPPNRLF